MEKLQIMLRRAANFAVDLVRIPLRAVDVAFGLIALRRLSSGVMLGPSAQDASDEE